MERNGPERELRRLKLLLERETNNKFMLSLMGLQAGNGHQDLAGLSALRVSGSWLAPVGAVGPHWKLGC